MNTTVPIAICDDDRDDRLVPAGRDRQCPICEQRFTVSGRARYCSRACQQRAYRLRRGPLHSELVDGWAAQLKERGTLAAQTVYECSACEQRYLGSRRCDECQLFCRNLGLGGLCASCDEIVTVAELLGVANSLNRR
jgi:hypothetical protein